jgi:uncharacterized protein YjbI with pentapeptide repeats
MKHQIKHRLTESVLFECDLPDDTPAGMVTRHALEKATAAGANLDGAHLAGANLARANLDGANLDGANLTGASLAGANLDGANLAGANLARANLDGANLDGAYLAGTNLDGAHLAGTNLDGALLVGERPIFQIGPIGSRCAYFTAYLTNEGVKLRAGCFFGTVDDFTAKLSEEHGDNVHAKEYRAALDLIQCHAGLWTPPTP